MLAQCINVENLIHPRLYIFYKVYQVSNVVVRVPILDDCLYTFNKFRRFK